MSHDLKDLREVMESRSAAGSVAPDLHDRLRRRIGRGRRIRIGAGAAGAVLAAGALVPAVGSLGEDPATRERAPVLSGVPNDAFTSSKPKYGMRPLSEIQYSSIGRKAEVTYTPTGPHTMIEYRCETPSRVYAVSSKGTLSGGGCDKNDSVESYRRNRDGGAVTYQAVVVPRDVEVRSVAELDRYVDSHSPAPGRWSVRIYSGKCDIQTCYGPPEPVKRLPVQGLERLAQGKGVADGRARTVSFVPTGETVRLRVTCLDGAAVAVVESGGRPTKAGCEADERLGHVWEQRVTPGERTELRVAVLPAEAGDPKSTEDADIAKAMEGVEPDGTWKLEVFAR
ncbi:hypothetical protein [Actinomadura algeriensis]|uniref:Uncharacterized protein n=1 Tax=Actinomadura algeriensis TaxID=1679523 RepID=A0ABR9JR54_9ACTN|nr:hypothetical protein [Actinomadura algeriensis]MBE1533050.1 hypothetical protein [Actinomadura algeriensis]